MTQSDRTTFAALSTLIVLQLIMLSALYAGIEPHPPAITPIAAIGPLIGASVAIALAAIFVDPLGTRLGRGLSMVAALLALLSFGPQKYMDAQIALIWPAVVLGQIAVVVIFLQVFRSARGHAAVA